MKAMVVRRVAEACLATLFIANVAQSQPLEAKNAGKLAVRIPSSERFSFSQQLLNGVTRDLDLDKSGDMETLNQAADSWTKWICKSAEGPQQPEDWIEFVSLANSIATRRQDFPLIVDSGGSPRLTAFVLPISSKDARKMEDSYTQWTTKGDLEAWGGVQLLIANRVSDPKLPDFDAELTQRMNGLYSSPTARNWNVLMYLGGDAKWNLADIDDRQQKFQVDRGVQRVLAKIDYDEEPEQAKAFGREYCKSQVANDSKHWDLFSAIIASVMAEKRLETVVTFVTRNSQGATKDATIAFHPTGKTKFEYTQQATQKLNSGEYMLWSERGKMATSDKMKHTIFSETYRADILEK